MKKILCFLFGWFCKRHLLAARSPKWNAVKTAFLKKHPKCAVCETETNVEVHHIVPFHMDKTRELDTTNLMSMCKCHHFTFGHLCNWKKVNCMIVRDAKEWNAKIKSK